MAQFTIRVPDELHADVKRAAEEDRRSGNGEIEWLLAAALARRRHTPGSGTAHQTAEQVLAERLTALQGDLGKLPRPIAAWRRRPEAGPPPGDWRVQPGQVERLPEGRQAGCPATALRAVRLSPSPAPHTARDQPAAAAGQPSGLGRLGGRRLAPGCQIGGRLPARADGSDRLRPGCLQVHRHRVGTRPVTAAAYPDRAVRYSGRFPPAAGAAREPRRAGDRPGADRARAARPGAPRS